MTLKQLRKQKKLTQVECAKYLGIPVRTYQNYELTTQNNREPDLETLCKISS